MLTSCAVRRSAKVLLLQQREIPYYDDVVRRASLRAAEPDAVVQPGQVERAARVARAAVDGAVCLEHRGAAARTKVCMTTGCASVTVSTPARRYCVSAPCALSCALRAAPRAPSRRT